MTITQAFILGILATLAVGCNGPGYNEFAVRCAKRGGTVIDLRSLGPMKVVCVSLIEEYL